MSISGKLYFIICLSLLYFITKAQEGISAHKLPFCSPVYNEFAPVVCGQGIIFCSNRKNNILINYTGTDNKPLTDIYFVQRKDSLPVLHYLKIPTKTPVFIRKMYDTLLYFSSWNNPRLFSSDLATKFNDGPACFNAAEDQIWFTRNNSIDLKTDNDSLRNNTLGIYSSMRKNNQWEKSAPFPFNSREYNVLHPFISMDGKQIFFASDMPGGYGGMDIYYCDLVNGNWNQPVNAGNKMNTSSNEIFPFLRNDGLLFFSSDYHKDSSGYDLYYSKCVDEKWIQRELLQAPFNSLRDDICYFSPDSGKSGYFTSNRDGSDDLFSFHSLFPVFEHCDTPQINDYCYVFYETGTINIDTLPVTYEWDMGDGTKIKGLEAEHCFAGPGLYTVSLNVIDTLTGETYFNQATYDFLVEDIEQPYITCPDTAKIKQEISFDASHTNLKSFDIIEYYWDFGDKNIAKGITVSHNYKKAGSYSVILGITGTPENGKENQKICIAKTLIIVK